MLAYREALKELTQNRVPLDWATTQNNLGNALGRLGERESEITHMEEAVTAFQEALKEKTRDRVPLDWAITQNNLGNALRILGHRGKEARLICDALQGHVMAWEVFSRAEHFFASEVAKNIKKDIALLKQAFPPQQYEDCLKKHEPILKKLEG